MRTTLLLLTLVLGLSLPGLLHAQPKGVVFEHLTSKDGLPENSVMAMLQDTLGFLWLGTQNGLVKYDGIDMRIYLPDAEDPHSIGGRTIKSLVEDRSGDLWVGTFLNGLSHFDRATERFTVYQHDPDHPNSLPLHAVRFIHEDRAGQIWLITGEGDQPASYLNRLDPATGAVTRYHGSTPDDLHRLSHEVVTSPWISDKGFFAFLEDRHGDLWVGTEGGGLNRYDRATDTFTPYRHDPADPQSLSHDRVASVFEDRTGRFWVGTLGGGLNLMDRATGTFTAYRHDPHDANSLSHDVAAVFFEDRAGHLWVTTAAGLDRFDPETGRVTHYPYDPATPNTPHYNVFVPVYEEADGQLWLLANMSVGESLSGSAEVIGVNQITGPFRLNLATGAFTWYRDDPNDPDGFKGRQVSSYLTDRSGVFWLGSWTGGLNKVDPSARRFSQVTHDPDDPASLSDNGVSSFHESPTEPGVLWVGTTVGLDRLDRATGRVTRFRPGDPRAVGPDRIFDLHEDRRGRLWIATRLSGVSVMDRQTGQFTRYMRNPNDHDDPTQLGGRWAHAILEDRAGTLWFGTEGVDRYDPNTGIFTHYWHDPNEANSLISDRVEILYEDRAGTIWIGSEGGGLSRFNPQTKTFTNYSDAQDGPVAVHALYEDNAGRFWVGDGLTGLHLFDRETGTSTSYTLEDGLPGSGVFGIEEDVQGQLWMNTSNGTARFDPETETFAPSGCLVPVRFTKALAASFSWQAQKASLASIPIKFATTRTRPRWP